MKEREHCSLRYLSHQLYWGMNSASMPCCLVALNPGFWIFTRDVDAVYTAFAWRSNPFLFVVVFLESSHGRSKSPLGLHVRDGKPLWRRMISSWEKYVRMVSCSSLFDLSAIVEPPDLRLVLRIESCAMAWIQLIGSRLMEGYDWTVSPRLPLRQFFPENGWVQTRDMPSSCLVLV